MRSVSYRWEPFTYISAIRLALGDQKVLVGFTDGTVDIWDVKSILTGTVGPGSRSQSSLTYTCT
jgi:hypothetical protein